MYRESLHLLIVVFSIAGIANAKNIVVRPDGNGDYKTIQAAVLAAKAGDYVVLEKGIYSGQGNSNVDLKGKSIIVRSTAPSKAVTVEQTVIDCGGSDFGFVENGKSGKAVIAGLTISNALNAAVYSKASITVVNCVITGCIGAAIQFEGNSSPAVAACILEDNGDGIVVGQKTNAYIYNCSFLNNADSIVLGTDSNSTIKSCSIEESTGTGIVCCVDSKVFISKCLVSRSDDVGVWCEPGSFATISDSYFAENGEAGIWLAGAGAIVRKCVVTQTAAIYGAGICCDSNDVKISNTLVIGNRGDGLHINSGKSIISNCTIADNLQNGLKCEDANPSVKNTIVWGNKKAFNLLGRSLPAVSYSNIQGGFSGKGNINADPLFASAGKWTQNRKDPNAPTFKTGDYHLRSKAGHWAAKWANGGYVNGKWNKDKANSPCIDAGDPRNACTYEPAPNGGRIDMGSDGNTQYASKTEIKK